MFQFLVQIFVLSVFASETLCEARRYRSRGNRCRVSGSYCVTLTGCRPFMDLITAHDKPLRPSVVVFLRSQECGFRAGYPRVCCTTVPKGLQALVRDRDPVTCKNATTAPEKVQKVNGTQGKDVGKVFGEDASNNNVKKNLSDVKEVKALQTHSKTQGVADRGKISQKAFMRFMDDVGMFNFLFRMKAEDTNEEDQDDQDQEDQEDDVEIR